MGSSAGGEDGVVWSKIYGKLVGVSKYLDVEGSLRGRRDQILA